LKRCSDSESLRLLALLPGVPVELDGVAAAMPSGESLKPAESFMAAVEGKQKRARLAMVVWDSVGGGSGIEKSDGKRQC
jgi:hypothetical protein